jgi:hypothetical protein
VADADVVERAGVQLARLARDADVFADGRLVFGARVQFVAAPDGRTRVVADVLRHRAARQRDEQQRRQQ